MDNSKEIVMEVHSIDGGHAKKLFDMEKKDVHFGKVMAVGDDISDPKQMFSKRVDNEEEDIDCVILDGNPDKQVPIVNDGGDDSDDLYIVAENGQVACRDYPHPRHLCAKFPFNSTPHESYCDKCHCYVCDSVAPCVHWGNGVSSIDHCHASEKDSFWKALRIFAKAADESLAFVSKVGLTPTTQALSLSSDCFISGTGTLDSVEERGCHPSNNFNPYLAQYHLQNQCVGHIGKQVVSEGGVTPANQVLWFPNNNTLMHNEETLVSELYSATSTGSPYGAQISGCHLGENSHPNLVHSISQRHSVGHAGTQLVPEGGSTPKNLQLWPSNNPLMHSEEPPAGQFGFTPGTGTTYGAHESGCHPGNNIGYELQRQKVGRADPELIPQPVSSFKRPRISGGMLSNTGYLSSSSGNSYGYQFSANPMLSTNSKEAAANSVPNSSTWLSLGTGMGKYAPLPAQADFHVPRGSINATPVDPQIHTDSILSSLAMPAPEVDTQPRPESPSKSPVFWEPQAISPQNIYETVMPSILEQQNQKQNQKHP